MKSQKQLKELFDSIKKQNNYFNFNNFVYQIKQFDKDLKKRNIILTIIPSQSNMSRKISFYRYNYIVNAIYHKKTIDDNFVKIQGCGMDMVWHTLYTVSQHIYTQKEIEKYYINSLCSNYHTI